MTCDLVITKFIEDGPRNSSDEPVVRLLCETNEGRKVVFWGSQELGSRNVDSLKNQALPVMVSIPVEDCIPSQRLQKKYNVTYSVPEHAWIAINPEV